MSYIGETTKDGKIRGNRISSVPERENLSGFYRGIEELAKTFGLRGRREGADRIQT